MSTLRKFFLAALVALSLAPAFAAAPPPVPGLPDTERRTSYTISASTCTCAVNFALYGDSTDYQNWVEVWLNGVRVNYNDATYGWTITSPTGSLATIPRPITDAVLIFNSAQTGTVQIVGARRPRRVSQFSENRGVAARDLNQALTDIVAQNRETWDKINDVTGRALISQPGVTLGTLPTPTTCENKVLGFDATGLVPTCLPYSGGGGSGDVVGPDSAGAGNVALFDGTTGKVIKDGGALASIATSGSASDLTSGTVPIARLPAFAPIATSGSASDLSAGIVPVARMPAPSSWFDAAFCNTVGYLVARTTGGWVCSRGSPVNVVWFGADPTGTNDSTAAFNAAMSSTSCNTTCRIWIPQGTYLISSTLTIPSRMIFQGENKGNTVLKGSAATSYNLLDVAAGGDQEIRDLSLTYANAQSSSAAIAITNAHNVTVDDVVVFGTFYWGVYIGTGANGYINTILNVETSGGHDGLYMTDSSTAKVLYSDFNGASNGGITILSSGGAQFSHVNTLQCGYGMILGPGNGQIIKGIQVDSMYLDTSTNENLRIAPSPGGTISSSVFTNLWLSSSQTGVGAQIGLPGGGTTQGITFTNPVAIGNHSHGMLIQNAASIVITGFQVTGNNQGSVGADGIYSDSTATDIVINSGRSGPSASFPVGTQNCGIRFAGSTSANNLMAIGNDLSGNVSGLCIGTPGSGVTTSPNIT